jgi:glutamate 5-kinase
VHYTPIIKIVDLIVTIKIGSNVLTKKDGSLNKARMAQLVSQISKLRDNGDQVILVSSGAVAAGRSIVAEPKISDAVSQRQLWSAIGQAQLINIYSDLFAIYDLKCAQLLVTKDDFRGRRHYLNLTNCLEALLEDGIVPIVNENDAISITDLMFTDNDELSAMVASVSDSSSLIILSNVNGIYDGNPTDENSELITMVSLEDNSVEDGIQTTKSEVGRGGMATKYHAARKMASQGVEVIIANGKVDDIINLVLTDERTPCTRFEADKKQSPVKKWIAQSDGFEKGVIVISQNAIEALLAPHATSLLPIGVVDIQGEFRKKDIVSIESASGERIGLGRTSLSSEDLKVVMGKKGEHFVVHYDYLFLDN